VNGYAESERDGDVGGREWMGKGSVTVREMKRREGNGKSRRSEVDRDGKPLRGESS